jgi:uncharacterized protein (DUF169 family)
MEVRREQDGVDLPGLADLLRRKARVRGNPVAITLFHDEVPASYAGRAVEPCAIVHHAMDLGERVYVDAEHHACLAGAWQAGFVDPPMLIKTGAYLAAGIPGMLPVAAARVKTGVNVLPQGMLRAIGAAPLDQVPADVRVDWIAMVTEPVYAATVAGVRTAVDGTPVRGAAGSSLCGELFAVPWHEDNVIMTPGDMGGRMFNKIRPNEMFVIVPMKYAGHYPALLDETPDVPALMDSIKPGFIADKQARLAQRAARGGEADAGAPAASAPATSAGPIGATMPWDDDCTVLLAAAPAEIREFAVPTMEEYAVDHGHERVTMDVMAAQMASIGMRLEDVMELIEDGS